MSDIMTDDKLEDEVRNTKFTYLVGIGVSHSVAPPMHNQVALSLRLPWAFKAVECPSIEDVLRLFRDPSFAGGVVTMPYKISVMAHLDGLDDHARLIGACNNVYKARDGSLRGTNTDWRGIKGCLASGTPSKTGEEGRRKPALIVGAGGAARAALYTLHCEYNCTPIYIANRDKDEVKTFIQDTKYDHLDIVYIPTLATAKRTMQQDKLPYFIVGTVPDIAPQSTSEQEVHAILDHCCASKTDKQGVLLDMCFKPRVTRTVKTARRHGWVTVEGVDVIGHQIEEQYRLWTGSGGTSPVTEAVREDAWRALRRAADENPAINF